MRTIFVTISSCGAPKARRDCKNTQKKTRVRKILLESTISFLEYCNRNLKKKTIQITNLTKIIALPKKFSCGYESTQCPTQVLEWQKNIN